MDWIVYRSATATLLIATVLGVAAHAQAPAPSQIQPDWRRVGNSAIDLSLAGLATGSVDRVWYSAAGSLLIHTSSGRVFETTDFESWRASAAAVPPEPSTRTPPVNLPEPGARVRPALKSVYSFAKFAYRSDSGGAAWDNLTAFRGQSMVGDLNDMAVSPSNDDEIAVASSAGVFRSMDGGKSWSGLNQSLPNLPVARLMSLPAGDQGVRVALSDASAVTWEPGQKIAWDPAGNGDIVKENQQRQMYSSQRATRVTAIAAAGDYIYTGMIDGRISVSSDGGATWQPTFAFSEAGDVARFWVDPNDSRVALAVLGARLHDNGSGTPPVHVVYTQNGGRFWDDLTANLPDAAAHGIARDRATGAIYAATDAGVFMTYADLQTVGVTPKWTPVGGLAAGPVMDVKLDGQGNQLWAAVEGFGVFRALAPHRALDPRVVNTANLLVQAAAPGSLVSVLGARVEAAHAGDLSVPVLSATEAESQLQIPFEINGSSVALAVDGSNGHVTLPPVPLSAAAPAIFVDADGSPALLDADSGVMLDAMNPAHSRGRIQIFATGLGRVNPNWPTGIPGPLENPPQVAAPVHAYLDGQPLEVTRAVLAPYIGFYLVEINVPTIVNYGPAELYLEVSGQSSNRVRVYIQP